MNMMTETIRKVIIYSGGLDSTTLLYQLHSYGYDLYPLTFDYGQKHIIEKEYAAKNCVELGLADKHKIIDLSTLSPIFGNSSLTNPTHEVPQLESINSKTPQILKQTVAPFRNGIFLSIATAYATSIAASSVHYAAHASDFATYPDCRPRFVNAFEQAAQLGTESKIHILADFQYKAKSAIVMLGSTLNVPFERTWSCYRGGEIQCGKCPSCLERRYAFKEAVVTDPTRYAD